MGLLCLWLIIGNSKCFADLIYMCAGAVHMLLHVLVLLCGMPAGRPLDPRECWLTWYQLALHPRSLDVGCAPMQGRPFKCEHAVGTPLLLSAVCSLSYL